MRQLQENSHPDSIDDDSMLPGSPKVERWVVVVVIEGGGISIEKPASGSKTPLGQQMVRSAEAAAAAAEARDDAAAVAAIAGEAIHIHLMRQRCCWWSHGQKLPDESRRPGPRQLMVEQGLHPHPGPTTWDRLWNEARTEAAAAFE